MSSTPGWSVVTKGKAVPTTSPNRKADKRRKEKQAKRDEAEALRREEQKAKQKADKELRQQKNEDARLLKEAAIKHRQSLLNELKTIARDPIWLKYVKREGWSCGLLFVSNATSEELEEEIRQRKLAKRLNRAAIQTFRNELCRAGITEEYKQLIRERKERCDR